VWAADPRPHRVVSINICTDQLLLMLADGDQVASISYLARERESSFVATQAMNYPVNHARLEELLALQPDLVLATTYDNPRLLSTLRHLGLRVERMALGESAEQIAGNLRQLAGLLGQAKRGEALADEMNRRLSAGTGLSTKQTPKAIFYQPRGYTSGRGTLQDEALRLAGWRNPAAEQGLIGYLPVDLERVLLWQPDLIITSPTSGSGDSRAERQLEHPALVRLLAGRPLEEIPYKYWICPGPMLVEAVEQLRHLRAEFSKQNDATKTHSKQ
jgi:iron complex transport system substrate-binding protein